MPLPLFDETGALFSPCRRYRYRLWRYWDRSQPYLVFLMLNPSTADELTNDPTVERCERRARSMGYGGLEVVNIFAYRATDPAVMKAQDDPVGPDNNQAILDAVQAAGMVVCAWGMHGNYRGRGIEVRRLLNDHRITPYCLRTGKDGQPGHPLYIGYDVLPTPLVAPGPA